MSTFTQSAPYLLTPGPLTTSDSVKAAMQHDLGSWDADFNQITAWLCQQLLVIADAEQDYACVPMQGSGTFSVEAALASLIAPGSTSLVLANGAYGQRIKQILEYLRKPYVLLDTGDFLPKWHFADFYRLVKQQGYLIYPGKLTEVNSFRVGSMGELSAEVMIGAVKAIANACVALGVDPQGCPPIQTKQYWTLR